MKGGLIILSFFILGVILGLLNFIPNQIIESNLSLYSLYFLMFIVGISVGFDKNTLNTIKTINYKIILIPAGVIIGTYIGCLFSSLIFPQYELKHIMAIGSGFGYYSLSSIFISEQAGETLGVIALLTNIFREIFTLLSAPLLAKYFGKLAPIFSGGATSMDTTLPIITKYSGTHLTVVSVFSGTVLTIAVPFLVSLFLSL